MNERETKDSVERAPDDGRPATTRRGILNGLNRWSAAVIASVVSNGAVGAAPRPTAAWVNGGGGSWVNRRGGWINGGGSWVNRSGGWINGGGGWINGHGGGGSWVNRRGGGGWVNR